MRMGSRDSGLGDLRVKPPSRGALLVGLVPFAAMCFSVFAWDRVDPVILGLPFNLFCLLAWTVLTPLCMLGAYHLETKHRGSDRAGSEGGPAWVPARSP